jgi:hypothetical protein
MQKTLTVLLDLILIKDAWKDNLGGLSWLEIVPLRQLCEIMDLMLLGEFWGLVDNRLHIFKLSRSVRRLNFTSSWSLSEIEELPL